MRRKRIRARLNRFTKDKNKREMKDEQYVSSFNVQKTKIQNLQKQFEKEHWMQPGKRVAIVDKKTGEQITEGIFSHFKWPNWLTARIEPVIKKIKKDGTASMQSVFIGYGQEIKPTTHE